VKSRAARTVGVPSGYRPRTDETCPTTTRHPGAGTRHERAGSEPGASDDETRRPPTRHDDFDGTEPVETNRRRPKLDPHPDECAACGHVHKHPEYPERKCWAPVPRAVGKLAVRVRIGRCRCRGHGDVAAEETPEQKAERLRKRRGRARAARAARSVICVDCRAHVEIRQGTRRRCNACVERRAREHVAATNARRSAAYHARAVQRKRTCLWCGVRRVRESARGALAFLCGRACRLAHRALSGDVADALGYVVIACPVGKTCERCGDRIPTGNGRNYARARWCGASCRTAAKNAARYSAPETLQRPE